MKSQLICRQIRKLRLSLSINQSEIAAHLGITQSSYAKIEQGKSKLSLERFLAISEFLNINPTIFFQHKQETKHPEKSYPRGSKQHGHWEEPSFNFLYIVKNPSKNKKVEGQEKSKSHSA